MSDYVLGLGANLGSRRASLAAALALLAERRDCALVAVSSLYESAPIGPPQPRYLNAAARVKSALGPRQLLARLLEIEAALGRTRGERWGARALDLDLLWASEPFADTELVVPHPELARRWFALVPLLEVGPELRSRFAHALRALEATNTESTAPRAAVGWELDVAGRTAERSRDGVLELEASAEDRPEALAAVLSALGAALSPAGVCRASEAPLLLNAENAADAVRLALAHASFSRATVSACSGECVTAHLLGCERAREPLRAELLEVAERSADSSHAVRVTLRWPAVRDM
jgi:2-amino-4-hydroxy-6-hydroxymethyldihydropteridine diphosphokinase